MRELTPDEVAAMWIYGAEYARSGMSATEWRKHLSDSRRAIVADFVTEMRAALGLEGSVATAPTRATSSSSPDCTASSPSGTRRSRRPRTPRQP
jgi:hypothetical protein